MLRLHRVYDTENNCWFGREDEASTDFNAVAEEANYLGDGYGRYEAREYGDFIQVTPEVRAAVEAIRGQVTSTLCPHELAILYWALAGIPEENGDGEG